MTWDWFTAHFSTILGDICITAGLFYTGSMYRREARSRNAQTLLDLTKSHRDLWIYLSSLPETAGLSDPARDLVICPRTDKETHIVSLLIHHFRSAFYASRNDVFVLPERLAADVCGFFSAPVPRDAWDELKAYHDRDFVAFVDDVLRA